MRSGLASFWRSRLRFTGLSEWNYQPRHVNPRIQDEKYRKELDKFSSALTLEKLMDEKDWEIRHLLYELQCVMFDKYGLQFYSEYGDFESPEELIHRSKEGDVYYIIAAFDYHS